VVSAARAVGFGGTRDTTARPDLLRPTEGSTFHVRRPRRGAGPDPVVVEITLERITNVAMGTSIDDIVEFDEPADSDGSESRSQEGSLI
jgi:hypothetical protein